jgi:hypothetical protein
MTNTWPGKPVCRPRNETSNHRTGSSSRHYTLTLSVAYKAHEMLYVFIYSVGTYGGQERCLEAFGGEIRGKEYINPYPANVENMVSS